MVPPKGYVVASNFSGFQNRDIGAAIIIAELPDSFQATKATFTPEGFKTQGMTLHNQKPVTIQGGRSAELYRASQNENGTQVQQLLLLFGDESKSVLLNASFLNPSNATEEEITKALLTASYNDKQSLNAEKSVKFKIRTEGTPYKFASIVTGTLLYSKDGKVPTLSPDKAFLLVGNSLTVIKMENPEQYSLNRLRKFPGCAEALIKNVQPVTIDKLNGYEIVAEAKGTEGKNELKYLVMLFDTNGDYLLIHGSVSADFNNNLKTFKSIAQTFSKK